MKYVLEYKTNSQIYNVDSFRMIFETNAKSRPNLVRVTSPTGKKELQTETAARAHWNAMVKEGWYRVEV